MTTSFPPCCCSVRSHARSNRRDGNWKCLSLKMTAAAAPHAPLYSGEGRARDLQWQMAYAGCDHSQHSVYAPCGNLHAPVIVVDRAASRECREFAASEFLLCLDDDPGEMARWSSADCLLLNPLSPRGLFLTPLSPRWHLSV